jgi:23S rRNA pseudouridine955/2504/2580 synthase
MSLPPPESAAAPPLSSTSAATSRVRYCQIESEQAGQRVDNFLMRELGGVPKTLVYRILRKGEVRVNKGRVKPEYRLQAGDEVRIPPVQVEPKLEAAVDAHSVQTMEIPILFEDNALLVVNKPSGLAVHGGSGLSFGLIELLRQQRSNEKYLELAHRLDRETSGVLLLAKSRKALMSLHTQLRERHTEKHYLALLCGRLRKTREINAALRKNTLQSGERVVRVDAAEGRAALSRFKPLTQFAGATFADVEILTGRTHQIRVHAQHAGLPLAGDAKYGERECNQRMRALGLKRLFLHASELHLRHPISEEPLCFRAPLASDLQRVLDRLQRESLPSEPSTT